jgi:hypothetical protein
VEASEGHLTAWVHAVGSSAFSDVLRSKRPGVIEVLDEPAACGLAVASMEFRDILWSRPGRPVSHTFAPQWTRADPGCLKRAGGVRLATSEDFTFGHYRLAARQVPHEPLPHSVMDESP